MPPRRGRSRTDRQVVGESRAPGNDEDVEQQSIPLRRRARKAEVEVDEVTRQIGEMELILARFQRMNPSTFTGAEGGLMAEGCLEHMEELFDAVEYSQERRLKLAILQLREHAQCQATYDDSVDHNKTVWYSGTATQLATTSSSTLDLSGMMTQPADHNVQRKSGSIYLTTRRVQQPTQVYCPSSSTETQQKLLQARICQHISKSTQF
ncbi:hypothetical protein F511_19593 [Dorcoceras hygrometricum]|uniref:Uncharacterized protein n=1 Tax=Dorcoceras hygrometricum TaxID=472368 RepID=A0A2Z7ADN5_9LAMI|nr:hypothetical protein F511_19593 [Dorcoceras hygrometricum]